MSCIYTSRAASGTGGSSRGGRRHSGGTTRGTWRTCSSRDRVGSSRSRTSYRGYRCRGSTWDIGTRYGSRTRRSSGWVKGGTGSSCCTNGRTSIGHFSYSSSSSFSGLSGTRRGWRPCSSSWRTYLARRRKDHQSLSRTRSGRASGTSVFRTTTCSGRGVTWVKGGTGTS